ncbi:MAG: RluA family pseudouridine synthase [bacterium]|nr:RluA family pseudouridine synthase [bacterium]
MISLIYETKDFIAVNKPSGVLVHPIESQKEQTELTLVDWVLERYPEVKNVGDDPIIRPGIVHRLDRDTSGVIIICRNQQFFEYLKNLFKTHQIKKTYLALVWGKLEPKSGEINAPIGIKSGTIKRTVCQRKAKDIKEAITEYKVLNYYQYKSDLNQHESATFSLLKVTPKTGRTHQIRIHLASVNHSVVGDKLYGFKKLKIPFDLNRQFLHATSLEFSSADGHRIKLEAELPEELRRIIDTLDEKS